MSLKVAVICASNQNRSMEGHYVLAKRGFSVSSFGTNREVKLPGPGPDRPNIYAFGTPYRVMHEELKSKDEQLYAHHHHHQHHYHYHHDAPSHFIVFM